MDNLPKKTNFILAANHSSLLDPPLVIAAIPYKLHCITASYLFRIPLLNWILKVSGAISTKGASSRAIKLLLKGKNIGIFPEGRLTRTGSLGKFRRGCALLALKTARPVVPCGIIGTYKALPIGKKFPRFCHLKVKIGKPIYLLKEFSEKIDDFSLYEKTARIRREIEKLINE